jgi:hypothetical protein
VDIWLSGTRFRVRDEAGRNPTTILTDISERRGLGTPARTMEEIMDVHSQALHPGDREPTEFYGDRSTTKGWVRRGGQAPWPIDAAQLLPAAEQILVGALDERLEWRGQVTRLGRQATELHGLLEGEEEGIPYRSEVTRVISPPFVLFSQIRDATSAARSYTREVVSLDEGGAADPDLTPP